MLPPQRQPTGICEPLSPLETAKPLLSLQHPPHPPLGIPPPDLAVGTVVQELRSKSNSVTPWTAARQTFLSFTISWSLLKLMSTESVMPSDHHILCCPLPLLSAVSPSIRIFYNDLRIRWPKYWSFSFSFSLSSDYSGLISFRIDRFDFLAVHGTLLPSKKK